MLALRVKTLWSFWTAQDLAFWGMCAYLVVEYVRPQQLVAAIYGWPLGQVTLGLAVAALFASGRGFQFKGGGTWLFLSFTAVIVMSSLGAQDPSVSYKQFMDVWITWVVIYFLIINVVNTEQRYVFFLLLWMMCHYYMSQGGAKQFAGRGFRFASWGIKGAPGWFENSGEFGIAMGMFTFISWHYYLAAKKTLTQWWRKAFVLGMPATAILGVIGCSSRGALLGLGAGVAWGVARRKPNPKTIIGAVALAGLVWIVVPPEQKARFTSAGEDDTSVSRLTYWRAGLDMARQYPVLGIGYHNWTTHYARYYREWSQGRVQVSHNIFIQAIAELGYIGLTVFVVLIIATPIINYRTRKLARTGSGPPNEFLVQMTYGLDGAMVCYVAAGFFVTVLYYPFFWINLALTVALYDIARRKAGAPALAAPAAPVGAGGAAPSPRQSRGPWRPSQIR